MSDDEKPNSLAHFEDEFGRVGWFIPPYVTMGSLSDAVLRIREAGDAFSERDLEAILATFYEPDGLAAMIVGRYPNVPVIQDFKTTIQEAVEAHFLGLHHVAVSGLIPVIEGAARRLAAARNIDATHVKDVFKALVAACKADGTGNIGEVASMMDSFSKFTNEAFFAKSDLYPFEDGTNRHGITHGAYSDADYGTPLNFYKTIAAVDFLTFVSSFKAPISWLAPAWTIESARLATYFELLRNVGGHRSPSRFASA